MLASQAGVCSRLLPKPLATAAAMRNRLQAGARGSCLQLPARCSTVRSSAAGPPRRRLSTTIAHRLLATPQSGIRVVMKAASEMDGVRMHCTARLASTGTQAVAHVPVLIQSTATAGTTGIQHPWLISMLVYSEKLEQAGGADNIATTCSGHSSARAIYLP